VVVDFLTLTSLLGRSLVDKNAQEVFSALGRCINFEDLGTLFKEFRDDGIYFEAQEKPKAKRGRRRRGGRLIRTICLFSKDYPGYSEYSGTLPGSVKFGESKNSVIEKLGNPFNVTSRKLPKPCTLLAYRDTNLTLNYEFDDSDCLFSVSAFKTPSEQELAKIRWKFRHTRASL